MCNESGGQGRKAGGKRRNREKGEDEGRGSTKGRAEGNVLVRAGAGRDGAGQLQAVGVALLGASAGLCLSVCLSCWEGGQEHMHRGPAPALGADAQPSSSSGSVAVRLRDPRPRGISVLVSERQPGLASVPSG